MPHIFRAKHNFQLAAKTSHTKLTMRPSEFLFRIEVECTDLDIRLGDQL